MEFLNEYIAPWVLPKQAIPVHCVWVPDENLKRIKITIPDGYALTDTLNFTQYDYYKKTKTVSISTDNLKSDNYFGIVLTYPKIIEDIEKRDEVTIYFLDAENDSLGKSVFHTRIVRPKLELLRFPKEIVVTDTTKPKDLINLEILHKGFGTANLNIDVIHSDKNISRVDSLYLDVLRDLFKRIYTSINDHEEIETIDDLKSNEEVLRETARVLLDQSVGRNLPFEFDEQQLDEVIKILRDETQRVRIYGILHSSLRSLLLAALLYYSERHPEEDVKLLYGQIVADLTKRIDELTIKICYYDSIWNKYPAIEAKIRVIDKRAFKDSQDQFEAPINIVWKRDLLKLEDEKK